MILQHEFGTFCGDRYMWKWGQNIDRFITGKNSKNLSKHLHVCQKLGEQIVSNNGDCLPVAIVRPSIIGAPLKEPCSGWVDNIFGVTGTFTVISSYFSVN